MSLQDNDNLCDVDTKNMKWFGKTTMYYNICVAENSPIKTIDDFKNARLVSVGDGNVTEFVIKYLNKNHGTNIKAIKFPNSTQAALSVISGDTEAGIIADITGDAQVKNGKMRCIAFGDKKNSKSIEKLFPELPEILKEPSFVYFFGVKNADDSQFKKIITASRAAKENMDKIYPANNFESIKTAAEQINLEKEFYKQTTGLFLLTDKLR
jgi:tripartite-type tricarboxylate transporter receptor subunit TctC